MSMNIAAIQMCSGVDIEANLRAAERLLGQAAERGAELAVLPENFAVFDASALPREGEREAGHRYFSALLSSWAARFGLYIIGGTIPSRERSPGGEIVPGNRVRTRCCVHGPDGVLLAYYDKLHLFDVDVADAQGSYRESATIEPGDEAVVAHLPSVAIGLSICYDLRFPELFAHLCRQGAGILTVPAAFTYVTGEAHWMSLLRARAIENQCFVVGAGQVGQNRPTRRTWGHSCIISPWGEVLALQEDGEGVVMASIDPGQIRTLRSSMPLLRHKRFSVTGPHPLE